MNKNPLKFFFTKWAPYWNWGISCFIVLILIFKVVQKSAGQKNENQTKIQSTYNRADYLYNLENPTEETDKEALELFLLVSKQKLQPPLNLLILESLVKAGNIHQGYQRFEEANKLYHQALRENLLQGNKPYNNYGAFLYLGTSMYSNGIVDSAKYYLEKTAEISITFRDSVKLPDQERLYNSLGAIYFEAADYKQAIAFFTTALEMASSQAPDYQGFNFAVKNNIATCLIKLEKFDSAISIYKTIEQGTPKDDPIFQPLAIAYFEIGKYDKALEVYKNISFNSYPQKRVALNFIGRILMKKNELDAAKRSFDSAMTLQNMNQYRVKNKEDAFTYLYRGELSKKLGEVYEAIEWANKALNKVHLDFESKSVFDIPTDVANTVSPITFYQILIFKAELIYELYKKVQKKETLIAALNTYIKAFQTVNYIANNFDNDDAKIFLLSTAKNNYETAIEIAYLASGLDKNQYGSFLYLLESYKGTVLRQNIAFNTLKKTSGIPAELIKRERELKQLYGGYLTKINLATTEVESKNLQKRLTELRIELSTLQNSYEKYQEYSRINESDALDVPLKDIQKALDKETVLLNFFVGGKHIYLMAISRNMVKINKSQSLPEYEKSLKDFMTASLNLTEGSRYKGYDAGNVVFKTLIEPVYSSIKHYKKLIIIPDDYLFYLPFDALDRTAGDKEYLVKSHAIISHYSVSLLIQQGAFSKGSKNHDSTTAFAPFVSPSPNIEWTGLEVLPFSEDEVNNPRTLVFKGAQASKDQFMKSYNSHQILHLATHASLGKDSSANWIQLFPEIDSGTSGRLFVQEIYNLDLSNNNLVILSACESGAGLTAKGEGLLSLSRAFMYAGSKGIISTLYRTDDRVTAFLVKQLFLYLEKGLEPAIALQKSKIDLLNSKEMNTRFKSPNYWGNFVYIGKVSTNNEKNSYLWILVPLMLMILCLLIWFKYKTPTKP